MSDHIVNANKMISETPRTDSNTYDTLAGAARCSPSIAYAYVPVTLSRQLERELNAANRKIELLMSANADVARIADERDAAEQRIRLLIAERDTARRQADQNYKLREEFLDLIGTDDVDRGVAVVREMKERIKRLEVALKSIQKYWNLDSNEGAMNDACWHAINTAAEALEAKEAKP